MNISGIASLLLELAGQAGSKVAPVPRAEGAGKARGAGELARKPQAAPPGGEEAGSTPSPDQQAAPARDYPLFVPLPLRSEIYPHARFYARFLREKGAGEKRAPVTPAVFLCLVTENLGTLWFGLTLRDEGLMVNCFTESEEANRTLTENFPLLREELLSAGFSTVSLTSCRRSELGLLAAEILPKFEMHLLDRRV